MWLSASAGTVSAESVPASYTGRAVCAHCHADEEKQWSGSHHDLAMQEVSEKTVLGDFSDASLTHFGVTSTFFTQGDDFLVRTEGEDGKLHEYKIKYVFGVTPLQQYLIEFPGGRLQALSLAWDTRPQAQGGQRWFHLYPDEKIAHDDELHWSGQNQNWNSMCAECHSTHLQKNYDPVSRVYATRWSEIDVSCEACHGPGSDHLVWAEQQPGWEKLADGKGLKIQLDERRDIKWTIDPDSGNAVRNKVRGSEREIEMCARCHSRRSPVTTGYLHGDRFLDHYRPRLLDEGMYYPDGQIEDEVYVYGSFIQSRMYHAGVICSDCHDPHSLQLRASANAVCLQCHQATKYDSSGHHFHLKDAAGGSCVQCHMPAKTYMVVDPRHDHSIRIPRPDLSVSTGLPNACTNCHTDKEADWAAEQIKGWYGGKLKSYQRYAGALAAGRQGDRTAGQQLADLVRDTQSPDIARATAMSAMDRYLRRDNFDVLQSGLDDENPMVRAAAVGVLQQLPAQMRVVFAFPMLNDPVRLVRMEAARVLADIPPGQMDDEQKKLLDSALGEYIDAQMANAERAEAQHNLGILYSAMGQGEEAEFAYQTAIDINPAYIPAYVNLADFYSSQDNDSEAEQVLRRADEQAPGSAAVHHALGLSLVRQKKTGQALKALKQASLLEPGNARYLYVYAVALNSDGQAELALLLLQGAHNQHPDNVEILRALVAFHRDRGNQEAAKSWAAKLQALSP